MKRLLGYLDKVALVLGMVVLLGAAAWTAFIAFPRLDEIAARNPVLGIPGAGHEAELARMPTITQVAWPDPVPQSRGRDWLYDVFTPPVIYVNPATSEFTVTPPAAVERREVQVDSKFEVELVRVRQEEYRIQLVSYAGEAGAFRLGFELVDSGSIVLARVGDEFPAANGSFSLRSFDVRRQTTQLADSMPVTEVVGVAVILDGLTGREKTLTTRERAMLPSLQCVLRETTFERREYPVREGGSVTVNGFEYQVIGLSINPQQAVVSRRSPSQAFSTDTKTLTPLPDTAEASRLSPNAAAGHNTIDLQRQNLFPNIRGVTPLDPSRLLSQYP